MILAKVLEHKDSSNISSTTKRTLMSHLGSYHLVNHDTHLILCLRSRVTVVIIALTVQGKVFYFPMGF